MAIYRIHCAHARGHSRQCELEECARWIYLVALILIDFLIYAHAECVHQPPNRQQ